MQRQMLWKTRRSMPRTPLDDNAKKVVIAKKATKKFRKGL
jgi:hypothetical protein